MTDVVRLYSKINELSLKTYGPRRTPVSGLYMKKDEVIAMSPLGSSQPTEISKRVAKHRESLPPILKKALQYLYPAKFLREKPIKNKYDSMVRKMSNFSLQLEASPREKFAASSLERSKKKEKKNEQTLMKKMSGIFDFPKPESIRNSPTVMKKKSKSVIKLPTIVENQRNGRFSSSDYINCINYTGEPESEYLKSYEAQAEYKKLYELMLMDSGLYSEIRIRHQNKNRLKYRRMPV